MKSKIGILAIILSVICFIIFLYVANYAYDSYMSKEYWSDAVDEHIERYINDTELTLEGIMATANMTPAQREAEQTKDAIKALQYETEQNWYIDVTTDWGNRFKIYVIFALISLLMTILFILTAILFWRIDNLKPKK